MPIQVAMISGQRCASSRSVGPTNLGAHSQQAFRVIGHCERQSQCQTPSLEEAGRDSARPGHRYRAGTQQRHHAVGQKQHPQIALNL